MPSSTVASLSPNPDLRELSQRRSLPTDYADAEQLLIHLLQIEALDQQLQAHPEVAQALSGVLNAALAAAYGTASGAPEAHRFLQRVLYRINRLKLFWYDDLNHYINENSTYLQQLRQQIEAAWHTWELTHLDLEALQQVEVESALQQRAATDLDPPLSEATRFLRQEMNVIGYQHLLAIASQEGLIEASRMTFILGGASNEVQCILTRIFLEEYGNGQLQRKHSTFFAKMLAEFNLKTEPEAYFDLIPWEVLAVINHSFLLTSRRRHFLRYIGGLTYFEVAGPAAYRTYLTAAQRLGLSEAAMGYWELHIREDERHGRWMLE